MIARLKSLLKGVVEDRSPRFLLGTIALGVVVALIAGFLIGSKYENSRGNETAKVAPTRTKPKTTKPTIKAAPLLIGAVLNVKPRALVIVGTDKNATTVTIGPSTRFAVAKPATASSIVAGSKVVFQSSATGDTTATEIVVLPKTALLGTPVTSVKPGASMTLKTLKGAGQVIKTAGAKVIQTGPGTSRMAVQKSRVIVLYFLVTRGNKQTASAKQIVIVPASSSFR